MHCLLSQKHTLSHTFFFPLSSFKTRAAEKAKQQWTQCDMLPCFTSFIILWTSFLKWLFLRTKNFLSNHVSLLCFSIFSHDATNTKNTKKISSYDHQISLFSLSPCRILCLPLTEKVISKTAIASTHFLRFSLHIILMAIQNDGYNVLKIATTNDVHHHYYQSPTIIIPRKKVEEATQLCWWLNGEQQQ